MQGAALAALHEANRHIDAGRHDAAAPIFAHLAAKAEQREMHPQAVRLHLRTAQSLAHTGDGPKAAAHARTALDLMLAHGKAARAAEALQRIVEGLRKHGLEREAAALEQEYGDRISHAPLHPQNHGPRGRLPARCSTCAAPARSDEVEWIDAHSAACAYCGSVLTVSQ